MGSGLGLLRRRLRAAAGARLVRKPQTLPSVHCRGQQLHDVERRALRSCPALVGPPILWVFPCWRCFPAQRFPSARCIPLRCFALKQPCVLRGHHRLAAYSGQLAQR